VTRLVASRLLREPASAETRRLYLRRWTCDDFLELAQMYSDLRVMRYMSTRPVSGDEARRFASEDSADAIRQWRTKGYGPWAAFDKISGEWVGKIGLEDLKGWPAPHNVEIGWELKPSFWGRGLAAEGGLAGLRFGFEECDLERIISVARRHHSASRRVMEKCGLTYQATVSWRGVLVVWYASDRPTRPASPPGS
jgi:RimJ/RimL family protein N-acetyltransferase